MRCRTRAPRSVFPNHTRPQNQARSAARPENVVRTAGQPRAPPVGSAWPVQVAGLFQGGKSLAKGVFHGVAGVFVDPVKGAQSEGVAGFFKGVGKVRAALPARRRGSSGARARALQGIMGVVAKPTAGAINLASSTLKGIGAAPSPRPLPVPVLRAQATRRRSLRASATSTDQYVCGATFPRTHGKDVCLRRSPPEEAVRVCASAGTFDRSPTKRPWPARYSTAARLPRALLCRHGARNPRRRSCEACRFPTPSSSLRPSVQPSTWCCCSPWPGRAAAAPWAALARTHARAPAGATA